MTPEHAKSIKANPAGAAEVRELTMAERAHSRNGKAPRSGSRGGNPHLFKGMGYSNSPGGRRKYDKGAKERMGEVTPEVVEFWIATMRDKSEEMSHRMRASENIAWGFLGKPAQQVFAAHAHLDVSNEIPKNANKLDKAAALYAAMIGATDADAGLYDRPFSISRHRVPRAREPCHRPTTLTSSG
jgi:hypothetical protein